MCLSKVWAFGDSNPGPCRSERHALTNWAKRPYYAPDGNRTRKAVKPMDFKSIVFADFTTPAYLIYSFLTLLIYYSIFQKFCQEVLLTFSLLFQLLLTFCIISNFYLFVKNFYFFFSLTNQSLLVRNYLHLTLFSITQVVWNVK